MKTLVLVLLLAFIAEHAPWRLMGLMVETFFTRPGLTRVAQTNERYWDAQMLQDRLEQLGFEGSYEKDLTVMTRQGLIPVYGLTTFPKHTVQVEAALSWDARYAVLAHEGGHLTTGMSGMYTYEEGE